MYITYGIILYITGHVTMIGTQSKRCLNFGVAKKSCRICQHAKKMKVTPRKHSCRHNWSGSSKGMESYLTVKGLTDLKTKGLNVDRIVMDDDTTTFSRAKKSISPDLIKCSDKNHVVKNFTNHLYKIKEKHKSFSSKTISYFKKNFSYAISQNKMDTKGVRNNLLSIVPHAFGKHAQCQSWCKTRANPNYRPTSLPYGKYLNDDPLEADLTVLVEKYTSVQMLEKLANLSSSNANENLNYMIARKAPKSAHFSGSESLDFRVSAAVAQKNEGHSYILQV